MVMESVISDIILLLGHPYIKYNSDDFREHFTSFFYIVVPFKLSEYDIMDAWFKLTCRLMIKLLDNEFK